MKSIEKLKATVRNQNLKKTMAWNIFIHPYWFFNENKNKMSFVTLVQSMIEKFEITSDLHWSHISVCVNLTFTTQNLLHGEPEALVIGHVEDWVNTAAGVRHIERIEAVLSDILWQLKVDLKFIQNSWIVGKWQKYVFSNKIRNQSR